MQRNAKYATERSERSERFILGITRTLWRMYCHSMMENDGKIVKKC